MKVRKHGHYYKGVHHLMDVDVYRVLSLFQVTDQALGHAIKKLLVAGGRGAGKGVQRDVREAIETLERWEEMLAEDTVNAVPMAEPADPMKPVQSPLPTIHFHLMPEAGERFELRDQDLKIDTYRSPAQSQMLNAGNSAVRITHLPSGLAVDVHDDRSMHANKANAMMQLRELVSKMWVKPEEVK
jgi:hypothetical protein